MNSVKQCEIPHRHGELTYVVPKLEVSRFHSPNVSRAMITGGCICASCIQSLSTIAKLFLNVLVMSSERPGYVPQLCGTPWEHDYPTTDIAFLSQIRPQQVKKKHPITGEAVVRHDGMIDALPFEVLCQEQMLERNVWLFQFRECFEKCQGFLKEEKGDERKAWMRVLKDRTEKKKKRRM